MSKALIAQAAEAKIYKDGKLIIKERVSKGYRHPELDKKLIKQRTKREAKLLEKASKMINAPLPQNLQEIEKSRTNSIIMPFIEGKKLSENLENLDWKTICKEIGNQIAKLHDNNIIHGDLTTSNMIWVDNSAQNKTAQLKTSAKKSRHKDTEINNIKNINNCGEAEQVQASEQGRLFFIDFGLGFTSERIEDRAVDLHLIKQALEAKHFSIHKEAEKIILENYASKDKTKVLLQLKKVEARGRYKH
jgi:TP53 regulating kinase-like protein